MSESLRSDSAPAGVSDLAAGRANVQDVVGSKPSTGTITWAGNLSAGDTITVNGVVFTAVAAGPGDNEFAVAVGSLSGTLSNFANALIGSPDMVGSGLSVNLTAGATGVIFSATGLTAVEAASVAYSSSSGTGSGTLSGGQDEDPLDVAQNALFALHLLGDDDLDVNLPDGEKGQRIVIYVEEAEGAHMTISGSYVGSELEFDDEGQFAYLLWTEGGWLELARVAPEA